MNATPMIIDAAEQTQRAEALFQQRNLDNLRRVDRWFAYLMFGQWVFAIALALWISPYTWVGTVQSVHMHVFIAVFVGGAISAVPIALAILRPGWIVTRNVIAVAQMLWSALLIHLSGGRIETHFHVFGSLAFLAFYRDWKVLVPATVVVAADHFVRQMLWPESVFGMSNPESWRFLEHAGWVVFEDVFLIIACLTSEAEMRKIATQQVAVESTERAAKEMEIAASIQTSILPRDVSVPGLEAAAAMRPAEHVGGDYYDVMRVNNGCWIAIGDVTGHGVRAGLTMLQAQSALSALIRHDPQARPADVWVGLNRAYFNNVRERLHHDDHMTFSLIRFRDDGGFEVVGAHEEIVIWRNQRATCETLPLSGTWVGLATDAKAPAQSFRLGLGDLLVLYTDGIIEARDENGQMVGIEAVREAVTQSHAKSVEEIRDAIFALGGGRRRDDDASVLVFRYTGVAANEAAA
ncbi:MAG: Signal transduction histidine kinase [Myxococcales bacterium]|nr:Signal transduction histidine kinase [Myxococcales bacterium]